jgi:hypothetical protein
LKIVTFDTTATADEFETAVVAAQQAFKSTFGDAAFQDASTVPNHAQQSNDNGDSGNNNGPSN